MFVFDNIVFATRALGISLKKGIDSLALAINFGQSHLSKKNDDRLNVKKFFFLIFKPFICEYLYYILSVDLEVLNYFGKLARLILKI